MVDSACPAPHDGDRGSAAGRARTRRPWRPPRKSGVAPSPRDARVVLALLPVPPMPPVGSPARDAFAPPNMLDELDQRRGLSLGLLGATQGRYDATQALLDIAQGTRVSAADLSDRRPARLHGVLPDRHVGRCSRAGSTSSTAPTPRRPTSCPGCSDRGSRAAPRTPASAGRDQIEGLPAANRRGRIRDVSIGPSGDARAARRASCCAAGGSSSPGCRRRSRGARARPAARRAGRPTSC